MKAGWFCGALLLAQTGYALAQTPDGESYWRTSASLETWGMVTHTAVQRDSPINPGNSVAAIASEQAMLDMRMNLRAEHDAIDVILYPRLVEQANWTTDAAGVRRRSHGGDLQLTQGFVRYKSSDAFWPTLVLGRELFAWGPATFRSPSSPFYFDPNRTNPLAATAGIDLARGTWSSGPMRYTAAYVFSTGELLPKQDHADTSLIKVDRQGGNYLLSLITSQQRGAAPFFGGFAQLILDDAWLLYAEFGSSRQAAALAPDASASMLFTVQRPAPRRSATLAGASYTLENGQVLVGEYLHDGNGYDTDQEQQYFSQARTAGQVAQTSPAVGGAALGQALGLAPRLLGRDYLSLSWQSNGQDSRQFWRLGWVQNLNDRSGQAQLYYERNFVPQLSGFLSATINTGDTHKEFGMLLEYGLTIGVKWFAF